MLLTVGQKIVELMLLKAAMNARSHEGDLSEEVYLVSMSFFVA